MLGGTIAARALGDAGLRALASEQDGPRPAAVREDFSEAADAGTRLSRIDADARSESAKRP